jgi:hypothetical protein
MRRKILLGSALALLLVIGASAVVGWKASRAPTTIVAPTATAAPAHPGFDWELTALVLTGLGTTGLAIATGALAMSTWQDVRASQQMAAAALEANQLAHAENERRPQLSLSADRDEIHSRAENQHAAYVRLLVSNAPERRVAKGTRVLVDHYRPKGQPVTAATTLGSPSLGWPSAPEASRDAAVVVFAGAARPIDLGVLQQGYDDDDVNPFDPPPPPDPAMPWRLKLALHNLHIADHRQYLKPGQAWVIRLVVGSDEADAKPYDVTVKWEAFAANSRVALQSIEVEVDSAI